MSGLPGKAKEGFVTEQDKAQLPAAGDFEPQSSMAPLTVHWHHNTSRCRPVQMHQMR